jgi:DNA-binding PadR family transcriptional regulator
MLALLSGAPGLSGYPLSRLAQAGSGTVHVALARMEGLGWVDSDWYPSQGLRRRAYSLTPQGRAAVTLLLGMEARDVR